MNGVLTVETTLDTLDLNSGHRLLIGSPVYALINESTFLGSLDELRLEGVVRDEDWIKMNYDTQKIDADLVQINF